jgi:hypothetical protein
MPRHTTLSNATATAPVRSVLPTGAVGVSRALGVSSTNLASATAGTATATGSQLRGCAYLVHVLGRFVVVAGMTMSAALVVVVCSGHPNARPTSKAPTSHCLISSIASRSVASSRTKNRGAAPPQDPKKYAVAPVGHWFTLPAASSVAGALYFFGAASWCI